MMFRSISALLSGGLIILAGMSLASLGVIGVVAFQLPVPNQISAATALFVAVGIGIIAGYVTGMVARRTEVLHAAGVVTIEAGLFLLSLVVIAPQIPWTERWPGLLAVAAGVLLGGYLRHRQARQLTSGTAAAEA